MGGALVEISDASTSSNSTVPNAGLTPAHPWELLNPLNPESCRVYCQCEYCPEEVLTEYCVGGDPYISLHTQGWSKVGRSWKKAKCRNCTYKLTHRRCEVLGVGRSCEWGVPVRRPSWLAAAHDFHQDCCKLSYEKRRTKREPRLEGAHKGDAQDRRYLPQQCSRLTQKCKVRHS